MNDRKLQLVMMMLETVDVLLQESIGESDLCYDLHNRVQDLVDDIGELVE